MTKDKGQPEYGKQYALTGKTGEKCIMNGNTWAESEVGTFQNIKETYHRMPEKFRKHGDMPTQVEMQDDVDNYKNQ